MKKSLLIITSLLIFSCYKDDKIDESCKCTAKFKLESGAITYGDPGEKVDCETGAPYIYEHDINTYFGCID